eukprot:764589-Prymnesium_polylepis.1
MGSADRTLSLGDVSVFALNGVPPRPYPSWLQTTLAPLSLFQKSANRRSNGYFRPGLSGGAVGGFAGSGGFGFQIERRLTVAADRAPLRAVVEEQHATRVGRELHATG